MQYTELVNSLESVPEKINLSGIGVSRQVFIHNDEGTEELVVDGGTTRLEVPKNWLQKKFPRWFPPEVVEIRRRSKGELNWGYVGESSTRFAKLLLGKYLPEQAVNVVLEDFLRVVVCNLPQGDFNVTICLKEIIMRMCGLAPKSNPRRLDELMIVHEFNYKQEIPEFGYMGRHSNISINHRLDEYGG